MPEQSNRNMSKDYDASDVKHVMHQMQFNSWDQIVDWLQKHGMNDNELTPSEAQNMMNDFQQLAMRNEPFTMDPDEAMKMAKKHRKKAA